MSFLTGTVVAPKFSTTDPELKWKREYRKLRKLEMARVRATARKKNKCTGRAERALRLKWKQQER